MKHNTHIKEQFSLKQHNTFGVEVKSRFFVEITSVHLLQELLSDSLLQNLPKLILGEGSNVLFTQDFPGLIIKMSLKGIEKTMEDDQHAWITAAAGENWHQLVLYCIKNNLSGIENLSLIPGTVGAAPMQNIGAYGVELRHVFDQLNAVRLSDGKLCIFDLSDCRFGYRDSVFKNEFKNQYAIVSVRLRLNKKPIFYLDYGAIKETLAAMQVKEVNIQAISDAVIRIRQQKLPDPKKLGNAGSFFKSPLISKQVFALIQQQFPDVPHFTDENEQYKIPAGWFIEQCGWKGRRFGNTGVHEQHALVLVNYGNGSGLEIKRLAEDIQTSVKEKFAIELVPEVSII